MKLFYDLLPLILFFAAYKIYDIYVATAVIIASSILQVTLSLIRHKRVEKTYIITLVSVVILGGATLLFRNPDFIKWKPTIVNWILAIVFLMSSYLGSKTLVERMMGSVLTLSELTWKRLNLSWVIFFIVCGIANLYVAYQFSESSWVNFKVFGLSGMSLLFILGSAHCTSKLYHSYARLFFIPEASIMKAELACNAHFEVGEKCKLVHRVREYKSQSQWQNDPSFRNASEGKIVSNTI